jgi:hypothetical protein
MAIPAEQSLNHDRLRQARASRKQPVANTLDGADAAYCSGVQRGSVTDALDRKINPFKNLA